MPAGRTSARPAATFPDDASRAAGARMPGALGRITLLDRQDTVPSRPPGRRSPFRARSGVVGTFLQACLLPATQL